MSCSLKCVASVMAWPVAATSSSGAGATSNWAVSCLRTPRSASASSSRTSTSSSFFRLDSALRSSAVESGCLLDGTFFFDLRLDIAAIPSAFHFVDEHGSSSVGASRWLKRQQMARGAETLYRGSLGSQPNVFISTIRVRDKHKFCPSWLKLSLAGLFAVQGEGE